MDRPERRWCRRVLRDTQDRSTCSAASTTTSYEHQIATTQPRERRNSTLSTLDNATTASTPSRSRPSAAWTRRPRRPEQPAVSRSRFPFGLLLCMGQRASEPGPRSRSLGTNRERAAGPLPGSCFRLRSSRSGSQRLSTSFVSQTCNGTTPNASNGGQLASASACRVTGVPARPAPAEQG